MREQDDAADDPEEVADLIAEILAALYAKHGADPVALFDAVQDEPGPDAAESVQEAWAGIDHPRGKGGRFIPKNSPEAHAAAKEGIDKALKEQPSPEGLKKLTEHLSILTTGQLRDLKKQYGLSASGKTKDALREKIAARLDKGRREPAAEPAAPAAEPAAADTGQSAAEWHQANWRLGSVRRQRVENALAKGIAVPQSVLADYPDLAGQQPAVQAPASAPASAASSPQTGKAEMPKPLARIVRSAAGAGSLKDRLSALADADTTVIDPLYHAGQARTEGIGHNEYMRRVDAAHQEYERGRKSPDDKKRLAVSLKHARDRITNELIPGLRRLADKGIKASSPVHGSIDLHAAADFYEQHALPAIDEALSKLPAAPASKA